jgi:hypothetical protein
MKKFTFLLPIISLLAFFSGCKDSAHRIQKANVPIYQDIDDWRATTFELQAAQNISEPGQIYIYGDILYVVEPFEGIHIFDNSNAFNPVNLGFIEVLACTEVAVRNSRLFTNSYFDLLVFDVTNPKIPAYVSRTEDVFQFSSYSSIPGYDSNYLMAGIKHQDKVIIGWEIKEAKFPVQSTGYYSYQSDAINTLSSSVESVSSVGQGGSLARFTIVNTNLYVIDNDELIAFGISNDQNLNEVSRVVINRNCETIFPNQGHLFIGTTTGVLIYDLTQPDAPSYLSEINHVLSCDPVVADGGRAYATLSTGSNCWGDNSLQVMDISTMASPSTITTYQLTHPQGLGVDGSLLFVCDDQDGLRIFDRTDDLQITNNLIKHIPSLLSTDVIPFNDVLIVRATDGIYQYDYSDVNNINLMSTIPVQTP